MKQNLLLKYSLQDRKIILSTSQLQIYFHTESFIFFWKIFKMLLKISILSIVILTAHMSQSLQYKTMGNIVVCLGNKTIEVEVSPDNLICQVSEVPNQKFRDDYNFIQGIGWYKFHNQAKTWNEARKICESEAAYLAIINSKAEEKVILELLNNQKKYITGSVYPDFAALGGHNWFGLDDWMTILGESLSSTGYVNWSKGCHGNSPEPNNMDSNEHCLSIVNNDCQQGLNDYNCQVKLAFVCEKPDLCS